MTIAACCVSCGSEKGGEPTKICGKVIDPSPAGVVPDDASVHDITATFYAGTDDMVVLRTAAGCRSGADLSIEPADAADIVRAVQDSDKRYIAVELMPHRDAFTVRVTRSPTSVSIVTVKGVPTQTAPVSP